MNKASMPGVAAIASALAKASGVSIIAKVSVPLLAAGRYSVAGIWPCSMVARGGPNERSPSGGYLAAAANWRASAALLIIGAMIASAPKASARLTSAKSFSGTRTIAAAPA